MEGLQKAWRSAMTEESVSCPISSSQKPSFSTGSASSSLTLDQSRVLLTRHPRQVVSLFTCTKFCAVFFVAGVVVGYTLKRRVRRWAAKLLKRLKDD